MFGRKLDMLKTIAVTPAELTDVLIRYPTKSIIRVNDNLELLLVYDNLDFSIINDLNLNLPLKLNKTIPSIVKSNVAIASAITSYARIEMMKYKTLPGINIYYSDTDSIFVDKELPDHFIGSELGQMKDELNGEVIKEAYFFGIKKYGYIDYNNKVKTVFSGIPRNSLTWDDIIEISNNKTVSKKIPDQFFKFLSKLEIVIKEKNINILFNPDKILVDNNYSPIHINDIISSKNPIINYFKFIYNKIKNLIRKVLK